MFVQTSLRHCHTKPLMAPRAFSEPCSHVQTFKETNFKMISMETIYSDFFHGNQ